MKGKRKVVSTCLFLKLRKVVAKRRELKRKKNRDKNLVLTMANMSM
jgi:hypothetical protein